MNTLTRYAPTFGNLRREIDRLFDDVMNPGNGEERQSIVWAPRADLSESDDRYVLRMDLPGLSKKDLTIELSDNVLNVSGERKSEREDKKSNVLRIERAYGRFFRSFTLPKAGDTEKVNARMEDGVLTIEVAKREELKPRRIEIA